MTDNKLTVERVTEEEQYETFGYCQWKEVTVDGVTFGLGDAVTAEYMPMATIVEIFTFKKDGDFGITIQGRETCIGGELSRSAVKYTFEPSELTHI